MTNLNFCAKNVGNFLIYVRKLKWFGIFAAKDFCADFQVNYFSHLNVLDQNWNFGTLRTGLIIFLSLAWGCEIVDDLQTSFSVAFWPQFQQVMNCDKKLLLVFLVLVHLVNSEPPLVGRWVENDKIRTGLYDFLWARG